MSVDYGVWCCVIVWLWCNLIVIIVVRMSVKMIVVVILVVIEESRVSKYVRLDV